MDRRAHSDVQVRQAAPDDAGEVSSILHEAAEWLRKRGTPLWLDSELVAEDIARHVAEGLYFLAECEGKAAGTLRFELTDPDFWPDAVDGESAFIHRLAVRRDFAGGWVSSSMLSWAADRARGLGRKYLRLDCDAARPRLRAMYERSGFRHHSDRQVGPFYVARYQLVLTG